MIIGLVAGILGGFLQGYFVFIKLFNKNVNRIVLLEWPRFWDCFSLRFYVILAIFDGLCVTLTDMFVKTVLGGAIVGSVLLMVSIGLFCALFAIPRQFTRIRSLNMATPDNKSALLGASNSADVIVIIQVEDDDSSLNSVERSLLSSGGSH